MRILPLGGVLFLGAFVWGMAASQDTKLNIRRIAGNVYMIGISEPAADSHGNSVVLAGDDGLLLVDGDDLPDPRSIVAELQIMFDKPIRYVIETACGGLLALSTHADSIVARDVVRRRVEQKKCWRGYPLVLPTVTFASEMSLDFDSEEVRVIKLPTGKTDGDALVYFKHARVVATGDAFTSPYLPIYSKYAGGNMLGVAEELRWIVKSVPEDVKVIPGHGPMASISDVRRASKALDEIRDVVAAQMAKGKTLDQLQEMHLLEPWKDLLRPPGSPDTPIYLKSFYDRLSGPPEQVFQLAPDSDRTH